MNIIIVGCGKVGRKLAVMSSVEEMHDVTVVDIHSSKINDMVGRYDIMGVTGSGARIDTLEEAGIAKADILIAVTGSDELNLLICFLARKLGNVKAIARVRKPEYSKEIHMLKEDFGLAMVINPEQTAASVMARMLRFPSAIEIDTFAKGRVEILKFRLASGSVLDELRIADLSKKVGCDILVCGVEREDKVFIPGGDFILRAGDLVSIVASIENSADFFKKIGINTNRVKDTIIAGGGSTSYYLANRLIKTGIKVKIIEQNPERCDELCQLLPKATIINGDATDRSVLLEEGIEYAESFVALTNMDEENILLSLFAKSKMNGGKLITKINKIEFDEVIAGLNLDSTIYPKDLTAEYIVRFLRAKNKSIGSNIETMHLILDGKAEALEFRINDVSPISGKPIESLNLKKNILIACITRNGQVMTPRGYDVMLPGDTVIVVTTHTGFKDINDILE